MRFYFELFTWTLKGMTKAVAERGGFEPPIPVKVCLISSQVHSTGLCHLSVLLSYINSTTCENLAIATEMHCD